MEVYTLPDYFQIENASTFKVFDYKTTGECLKQMVALKQNTFSFLVEGHKEVFADNTSVAIKNSSFLLMKSGHCLMTEKLANSITNYRSILFFFSETSVLKFIQKHKIVKPKNENKFSVYAFKYDEFLKTFVKGLVNISKLKPELQNALLELKFEALMLYLKETRGVDFLFSLLTNNNSKQQHFVDIVESNKLNKLSLSELSFLANMSVSTFKREFKKQFNVPPIKWFQDKRLEHAAYLLQDKSKRPSDVFEDAGYESLSNFIQAFKTKFKITPKQYQSNLTF